MKKHFTFFKKKTLAVFLATLFFCLALVSFCGIVHAINLDYYTKSKPQIRHEVLNNALETEAREAFDKYYHEDDPIGYYENTNFRFEIFDNHGTLLIGSYEDDEIIEAVTKHHSIYIESKPTEGNDYPLGIKEYTINAYMITTGADIFGAKLGFVDFAYAMRFVLIGLLALFAILTAACLVYLMWSAGKRPDSETPLCGPIERIPFDLYLLIYIFLAALALEILGSSDTSLLLIMVGSAIAVAVFLLLISFGMSISIRIQTKTLWKNTLIYIVFAFLFRKIRSFFRALPLIWKIVVFLLCYGFLDLLLYIISGNYFGYILIMMLKYIVMLPLIFYLVYQFRKLQKGAESIKNGGFAEQIDTKKMHGEIRSFGETLNTISDGLGKAVDARMKSERMKTELITNVSHDIKTPLTSIISYADLLKKEKIENERAKEYIEVIDRQASRLKKLITDLVEAFKASTGNIQVNLERLDVGVLLEQAAGEYDEKLKEASLIPVLRIPEEPLCIHADGRLLWRVFDNLLGNICKYSLSGTRVYLNAAEYGGTCIISFKNISRTELNISPDELVERFVRADSSRSTEGNGLGLSIAQSLIDLQGGRMEIIADGDLFKINLEFPIMKETT